MPDVAFVSGGNSHDVANDRLGIAATFPTVVKGTTVRRLIDRDDHSPQDAQEFAGAGITVLGRRNLEAYLYDDEVLIKICSDYGAPERANKLLEAKKEALAESVQRGNAPDDLRPAAPAIYRAAKKLLNLAQVGNDARAFERNVLAGTIKLATETYAELRTSIFPNFEPHQKH